MLSLDPLEASAEPRSMTIIEKGGGTHTLEDLLVGEIWMASGQSNMQWIASKCDVGMVLQKQINARVAAGVTTLFEPRPPARNPPKRALTKPDS